MQINFSANHQFPRVAWRVSSSLLFLFILLTSGSAAFAQSTDSDEAPETGVETTTIPESPEETEEDSGAGEDESSVLQESDSPEEALAESAPEAVDTEPEADAADETAESDRLSGTAPADREVVLENEIATAIEQQQYAQALELFAELESLIEPDVFLLRMKAFCLIELDRWGEALSTADRILALDPSDSYGAFYRAQALAGQNREAEAEAQIKKVVRAAPASAAAQLVDQELPEVRQVVALEEELGIATAPIAGEAIDLRSEGPREVERFTGRISVGMGLDDNANFAPRNGSFDADDSAFIELSLYLDYVLIPQGRSPVEVSLFTSAFRSFYLDDPLDDLDYTLFDVGLRFSRERNLFGRSLRASLTPRYRYAWLGDRTYYDEFSLKTALTYFLTQTLSLSLSYEWAPNNFKADPAFPAFFDRDGTNHRLRVSLANWFFRNRLYLSAGYAFNYTDTEGSQLEKEENAWFASAYAYLPWKFELGFSFDYGQPDYVDFVGPVGREDDTYYYSVSLRRELFVRDLDLVLSYIHQRGNSNQDFADYDRNIGKLSLEYSW